MPGTSRTNWEEKPVVFDTGIFYEEGKWRFCCITHRPVKLPSLPCRRNFWLCFKTHIQHSLCKRGPALTLQQEMWLQVRKSSQDPLSKGDLGPGRQTRASPINPGIVLLNKRLEEASRLPYTDLPSNSPQENMSRRTQLGEGDALQAFSSDVPHA